MIGNKEFGDGIKEVENQLKEGNPPFVTEIFFSLQKKGCNRKQARTLLAAAFLKETHRARNESQEYDEKRYEAALRKQNRGLRSNIIIHNITLDVETRINDACGKIWDALVDERDEEASALFLAIWPVMKEYVIHNLYRDTPSGVEKPDMLDVSSTTDYEMDFDDLLPEMGAVLRNAGRYEEAIQFSRDVLELFAWEVTNADHYKDEIGHALADMGKIEESDAWYKEWLEAEPDNGNCVDGFAFCHQVRGDLAGALKIVETHIPIGEPVKLKYENLYLRASELYRETDDMEKADHYYALWEELNKEEQDVLWHSLEEDGTRMPIVKEQKVYPNDPCPCGSGKKYKKCCGKN